MKFLQILIISAIGVCLIGCDWIGPRESSPLLTNSENIENTSFEPIVVFNPSSNYDKTINSRDSGALVQIFDLAIWSSSEQKKTAKAPVGYKVLGEIVIVSQSTIISNSSILMEKNLNITVKTTKKVGGDAIMHVGHHLTTEMLYKDRAIPVLQVKTRSIVLRRTAVSLKKREKPSLHLGGLKSQ